MIPKLKTERLILRPFTLKDSKRVQELAGDPSISDTTLNIPYPYENGIAEIWISNHEEKFKKKEALVLAITTRNEDNLIGAVSLKINTDFNNAELGYWIGKDYWNNGFATEAVNAVLEFGFNEFLLNKIYAHYLARNPSSGKVMQKVGMVKEGLFKQHIIKNGIYEDIIHFAILRDDYLTRNKYGKS
jgi:RimJ/RimL family protein N-acetyltransferase